MQIIAKGQDLYNTEYLTILCKDNTSIMIKLEEPDINENSLFCSDAYLINIDVDNEVEYLREVAKELEIEMEGPFIDEIELNEDGILLSGIKEEEEDGSIHVYFNTEIQREESKENKNIEQKENKIEEKINSESNQIKESIEELLDNINMFEFSEESISFEEAANIIEKQLEDMRNNKWPVRETPEKTIQHNIGQETPSL